MVEVDPSDVEIHFAVQGYMKSNQQALSINKKEQPI
jgi:hypothetical protein